MTLKAELRSPIFWLRAGWYAIGWYILMFAIWFVAFFTPVVMVDSSVTTDGDRFTFKNWSYKTVLANSLCGKPSGSILVFENETLTATANVQDNAKGIGAGNGSTRLWVSTGHIPRNLPVDQNISVYKKLTYPCLGFNKEVVSDTEIFYNVPSGMAPRGM